MIRGKDPEIIMLFDSVGKWLRYVSAYDFWWRNVWRNIFNYFFFWSLYRLAYTYAVAFQHGVNHRLIFLEFAVAWVNGFIVHVLFSNNPQLTEGHDDAGGDVLRQFFIEEQQFQP